MVAIAPSPLKVTQIRLEGVTWPTFQALMIDMVEDQQTRIAYFAGQLLLEHMDSVEHGYVVLHQIRWATYQALMTDVGDGRVWRIAYAAGVLELRMPLEEHEEPKRFLEDLVIAIVDELGIEVRSLGALTLEREDLSRAIEPDSCFYIQNEALVRGQKIRLPETPPPDLVIEANHTHSSLDKLALYASLGVPELWRFSKNTLQIYLLHDGVYQISDRSLAFPCFPASEVPGLFAQSRQMGQRAMVSQFRDRIRTILVDRSDSE